ncbi:MAG: hypothetical protein RR347_02635, partial [Anaerovoracaceae bacterium]
PHQSSPRQPNRQPHRVLARLLRRHKLGIMAIQPKPAKPLNLACRFGTAFAPSIFSVPNILQLSLIWHSFCFLFPKHIGLS